MDWNQGMSLQTFLRLAKLFKLPFSEAIGKGASMAERMIGVSISITRYVGDEPQPGIVECEFTDANGKRWSFVEKTAYVSQEDLDARTTYPKPGVIACEILSRGLNPTGQETVLVDTNHPWGVESIDGTTQFMVFPESLVEWDWGSSVTRPWDGRE